MPFLKTFISCRGRGGFIHLENVPIQAATLGEAIGAAERLADVRIIAHDPPKWFRVSDPNGDSTKYSLHDIHIRRGDSEICPKQDLLYPLLPDDIVNIGALAC